MLMDAIAEALWRNGEPDRDVFGRELEPIKNACAWTTGFWRFRNGERRRWNEIQNTSKDIALLSDHLLGEYRRAIAQ